MYILFDIGGTKTRVAFTDDLHTLREVAKFDTPPSYEEGIRAVMMGIESVRKGLAVAAIAGGECVGEQPRALYQNQRIAQLAPGRCRSICIVNYA